MVGALVKIERQERNFERTFGAKFMTYTTRVRRWV